jgi:integrase
MAAVWQLICHTAAIRLRVQDEPWNVAMTLAIWKVKTREALAPRREPYWGPPLGDGKSLGFRKIDGMRGRWIAKLRNHTGHHSRVLGDLSEAFQYDDARGAALSWFRSFESGITDDSYTVEAACRHYIEDRRVEKGEACAHDAEMRFRRTVYGTAFGKTPISKLWTPDLKKWRRGTALSLSSQNRTMTALRAALNLAIANRRVTSDRVIEWSSVRQHKNADSRRVLFLDLEERRRLLEQAHGAVRDLIAGIAFTGARPGDLRTARRSQYEPRTESITFTSKTGPRTVPLPKPAVALFNQLAKDKLPHAWLFTREDGKPWQHSDWDELVRDAAKRAGLPEGVCLYTLRHSFITQVLTDGMSTLDVARITGTSLAMIEKHYGHLVMDAARARLNAVNLL